MARVVLRLAGVRCGPLTTIETTRKIGIAKSGGNDWRRGEGAPSENAQNGLMPARAYVFICTFAEASERAVIKRRRDIRLPCSRGARARGLYCVFALMDY